jgi:hypothetical protein
MIDDNVAGFAEGFEVYIAIVAGTGFFFEDETSVFAGHYENEIAAFGCIRRVLQSFE